MEEEVLQTQVEEESSGNPNEIMETSVPPDENEVLMTTQANDEGTASSPTASDQSTFNYPLLLVVAVAVLLAVVLAVTLQKRSNKV